MASGPQATVGDLQVRTRSQVSVVVSLATVGLIPAGRAFVEVGQTAGKARQLRKDGQGSLRVRGSGMDSLSQA